jgi:hypothetical protein
VLRDRLKVGRFEGWQVKKMRRGRSRSGGEGALKVGGFESWKVERSHHPAIPSGRQRAQRGVAPPVLGIFSGYDSQPLRGGLNCDAPTALGG